MIYKTHIATSLSLSLLPYSLGVISLNSQTELFILLLLIPIFALMPDLDEPNSYLSRRTPILPYIIRLFTKHRAFTHQLRASFIFVLIPLLIINFFYLDVLVFIPGLFLAYVGHIIGDSFTVSGIRRFLYPISNKTFYGLPKRFRFKTGSFFELFVVLPFMSALAALQVYKLVIIDFLTPLVS